MTAWWSVEAGLESFSVLYFREGEVVAVNAVNAPATTCS